jgi:hypothetical protein
MEKNTYAYTVSRLIEDIKKSNGNSKSENYQDKETEFTNESPLIARKQAFGMAKSLLGLFEDNDDKNDPFTLPRIPWNEKYLDEVENSKSYEIRIHFKTKTEDYWIYLNDEIGCHENEIFSCLLKEYKILENEGFDMSKEKKLIEYYDWKDKMNKKDYILDNGMEFDNPEINVQFKPLTTIEL